MKNNTYDIPAFKFYFTPGLSQPLYYDHGIEPFLSFDLIDGINIRELKEYLRKLQLSKNGTCSPDDVAVNYIQIFNGIEYKDEITKEERPVLIKGITKFMDIDLTDVSYSSKIDEVVEASLPLNYDKVDERIMKCFLARYRYNTKKEVDIAYYTGKRRVRKP